jgi:hypothetical protein
MDVMVMKKSQEKKVEHVCFLQKSPQEVEYLLL